MKKALFFLLAVVLVVSSVLLVACDAGVVSIKIVDAPEKVTHGDTLDYSAIHIDVEFDDGSTKTLSLTDRGVSHSNFNTATLGYQQLSVTYGGQSDSVLIFVEEMEIDYTTAQFAQFGNTSGYTAYTDAKKLQTNKQTEFMDRDVPYQVGTANGYRVVPNARVLQEGFILVAENFDTTYKLYHKQGNDYVLLTDDSTYLESVANNVYYFTKNAEHEEFRLEVTLADKYLRTQTLNPTITQEFEVVDGYNVYDALGLSVLDNLNVKSWTSIKQNTLAWDSKPLKDYGDVSQVILHNNITVTANDLPTNYFWQNGELAKTDSNGTRLGISYQDALSRSFGTLKKYLEGSLKENYLGEDWEVSYNENPQDGQEEFESKANHQRGLYMSNGIGLSGNYLQLGYDSQFDENNPTAKGIYIVHDYKQTGDKGDNTSGYPEAHTSFIGYTNILDRFQTKDEDTSAHTRTVQNVYFVGDTQRTENTDGKPCGIMMIHANMYDVAISNTIGTSWFGNFELERHSSVSISDCKFYDSFSQMFYVYAMRTLDIANSEMIGAGGPLIIAQDASDDEVNIQINIDEYTINHMESWLSGAEMWFTINKVGDSLMTQLFQYATASDDFGYTSYRRVTTDGAVQVNFILALIPNPSDLLTNQTSIKGAVTIGDGANKTTYASVVANLHPLATRGADLASRTNTVLGGSNSDMLELIATFNALATQTAPLREAPIYQCGNTYGYFDGENLASFTQTIGGVYSLIGGKYTDMLGLAQILESMGQTDLAEEWTNFAGILSSVVGASVDTTDNWEAGQLVAWINPTPSDLNVQHFMLLLGENKTAA